VVAKIFCKYLFLSSAYLLQRTLNFDSSVNSKQPGERRSEILTLLLVTSRENLPSSVSACQRRAMRMGLREQQCETVREK